MDSALYSDAVQFQRANAATAAKKLYQLLLQQEPANADLWRRHGEVCQALGLQAGAESSYRQALRLEPHAGTLNNLGIVLMERGQFDEAAACYRDALELRPDYSEAYNNLGITRMEQGGWDDAMLCYRQALFLNANFVEAHYNLGRGFAAQGMKDEALASFEQAVQCKPDAAGALNELGNGYKDQGRLDEAITCYRKALAAAPHDAGIHSNLLYAMLYHGRVDPDEIHREHRLFGELYTPHKTAGAFAVEPMTGRRLRVGYVSPDFRIHVLGFYSELILAAHDRERFEIYCYGDVRRPDEITKSIQGQAEHWRSLVGLSHADAAEVIRRDRIDVLIDLAGHTGGNRLPMFALRPAPVQASHYGYTVTTGLTAMDYRITDEDADPPGCTERWHVEELIRLPEVWWCYGGGPPLDPGPLPSKTGRFTLGSFNNLAKVSDDALSLWARIMQALPTAQIRLLTGAGTAGDRRVLEAFARGGVGSERVTLLKRQTGDDYFRLYQEIDVALDPCPYTGCNTTADALWMGVPVVTLAGRTCTARQCLSLLRLIGLEEFITDTPEAYVAAAVRCAGDLGRLSEYRTHLRDRLRQSPVMDSVRFTRQLEAAYRLMWERQSSRIHSENHGGAKETSHG